MKRLLQHFLVLTLSLGVLPMFGQTADYVLVLLDCSGSMNDKLVDPTTGRDVLTQDGEKIIKLSLVKQVMRDVLTELPNNTHIGLLTFSSSNLNNDWAYKFGPLDKKRLVNAINKPTPGGSTPLGKYMKRAADALLKVRADRKNYYDTYRLFIVTDGEADDPGNVLKYTPEIRSRNIRIDVIGVGMAQDHILATPGRVNSYRAANNPNELKQGMDQIFAEVSEDMVNQDGENLFELIEPIPDETARQMVQALHETDDSPIGHQQQTEDGSSDDSGIGLGFFLLILVFVVVAVVFIVAVLSNI